PDVRQIQAWIDIVGLPLNFAASQVRYETEALHQIHTQQLDLLPIPVAKLAACKIRIVDNRVEARRRAVEWLVVARGVKERRAKPRPIAFVRKSGRRHLRVDVHLLASNRIQFVPPQNLVERMRDVEPVDVPVAVDANKVRIN